MDIECKTANDKRGQMVCFYRIVIPVVMVVVLLGCSKTVVPAEIRFHPEDIACSDESTQKMHDGYTHVLQQAEADSFILDSSKQDRKSRAEDPRWRKILEAIIDAAKELADKGNSFGMFGYGVAKYEKIVAEHLIAEHLYDYHCEKIALPDTVRDDTILALTYIYIAEMGNAPYHGNILNAIDAIEGKNARAPNKFSRLACVKTPTEWIAQAKANAQRWGDYCNVALTHPHRWDW